VAMERLALAIFVGIEDRQLQGLDLRLRTPVGFDAVEVKARAAIGARVARGACSAGLSAKRADAAGTFALIAPRSTGC